MRISGVTIPDNKRLEAALTAVYGIGVSKAKTILASVGVSGALRPTEISPKEEKEIRMLVENQKIEGELRREAAGNIKRLKAIKSYSG